MTCILMSVALFPIEHIQEYLAFGTPEVTQPTLIANNTNTCSQVTAWNTHPLG